MLRTSDFLEKKLADVIENSHYHPILIIVLQSGACKVLYKCLSSLTVLECHRWRSCFQRECLPSPREQEPFISWSAYYSGGATVLEVCLVKSTWPIWTVRQRWMLESKETSRQTVVLGEVMEWLHSKRVVEGTVPRGYAKLRGDNRRELLIQNWSNAELHFPLFYLYSRIQI
jgi:hypothetical protein